MHEHPQDDLGLLFDRARTPLAAEPFLAELEARLRAARRGLRVRRVAALLLGAALAASLAFLAAPLIARLCLALGSDVQSAIARLGEALASPAGWAISLLLALLLLRRGGVFGR